MTVDKALTIAIDALQGSPDDEEAEAAGILEDMRRTLATGFPSAGRVKRGERERWRGAPSIDRGES
jgi:hypothetical protein